MDYIWDDKRFKMLIRQSSARSHWRNDPNNIWETRFYESESNFRRSHDKSKTKRNKIFKGEGADFKKLYSKIYRRLVSRGAAKLGLSWYNIVGEMYYSAISVSLNYKKDARDRNIWENRIRNIMGDMSKINEWSNNRL